MASGKAMLDLAATRLGQKYVNVLVPKNNKAWSGPWDCAEFMSWLVYQTGGFLYGCVDNHGNPATTEAYTGAWQTDSERRGKRIPWQDAASIPGAILLRYPPAPGSMGHIVVSDGKGGTIEAMGSAYGVRRGKVTGRAWNTGVLIPGFDYDAPAGGVILKEPDLLFAVGRAGMDAAMVRKIQRALKDAGFDPGPIDGDYGHNTAAAVAAFQTVNKLIVDGQAGRQTLKRLKLI